MKRLLLPALFLASPAFALAGDAETKEWIPLFDGKSLAGWVPKITGYEAGVNFCDTTGEQAKGGPEWAFRNSGLMIHGQPVETMGKDQDFPISIEVHRPPGERRGRPRLREAADRRGQRGRVRPGGQEGRPAARRRLDLAPVREPPGRVPKGGAAQPRRVHGQAKNYKSYHEEADPAACRY